MQVVRQHPGWILTLNGQEEGIGALVRGHSEPEL